MSKSILAIDTPESCAECVLYAESAEDYSPYCVATSDDIDEFIKNHSKPNRCPLKPVPERKAIHCIDPVFMRGAKNGYNICIDELLKESER